MKRAAIYARVSTPDQHLESQLYDLRKLAEQRGYEVVQEYCDRGISGSKAKRPGLDAMMAAARRKEYSTILIASFDRIARSTKHFLGIIDELNELGIDFVSARESIDTSGPMGRMFITLLGSIAELERSILVSRIKSGMRRCQLEGIRLRRKPLDVDRDAIIRDRLSGLSLTQVAKKHRVSRATVCRLVKEMRGGLKGSVPSLPEVIDSERSEIAA